VPKFSDEEQESKQIDEVERWYLNIEFKNESEVGEWYDKLISEGLICKIVQ
jgi:hypothetical protein